MSRFAAAAKRIREDEKVNGPSESAIAHKKHFDNMEKVDSQILDMRKNGLIINECERITLHTKLMGNICNCMHC